MGKKTSRMRRALKTRARIRTTGVSRLCVHRTPRHIYAQVIAPDGGKVLASASTLDKEVRGSIKYSGNAAAAIQLKDAITSAAAIASGGANSLASGNLEVAQAAVAGAISNVATVRGRIGAYQSDTLQTSINSNNVALENLYAARSSILDTDYAQETSKLAMYKTLVQAGVQVVSTTQELSARVLDLLR